MDRNCILEKVIKIFAWTLCARGQKFNRFANFGLHPDPADLLAVIKGIELRGRKGLGIGREGKGV